MLYNELAIEEFDSRKWSVRKVRRRGTLSRSMQKNEEKDNVVVFGSNAGNISLDAISSDDDSTISDEDTDGIAISYTFLFGE